MEVLDRDVEPGDGSESRTGSGGSDAALSGLRPPVAWSATARLLLASLSAAAGVIPPVPLRRVEV